MAATLRRFLFMNVSAGGVYADSNGDDAALQIGKLTVIDDGGGVGLVLNDTEIQGAKKITIGSGVGLVGLALNQKDITGVRMIEAATITLNTMTSLGYAVDCGGLRMVNVGTPQAANDAVNKTYVDSMTQGVDWKTSVRAASQAGFNWDLANNLQNQLDGITLVAGDRILLKNQTNPAENGIYDFPGIGQSTGRSDDCNTSAKMSPGAAVFVEEGNENADTGWMITTNGPIVLGSSSILWTQFTSLGQINAGAGLTKTANYLNVNAGNGIDNSFPSDTVTVKAADTSLDVSASGVKVKLDGAGGITYTALGLKLNLAALPGLDMSSGLAVRAGNGISVGVSVTAVPNAAKSVEVTGSGIGIVLATTPGLQHNTGLEVLLKTNLAKDASGIFVTGVPLQFNINGSATGTSVTAASLNTLTNGSDASALHVHSNVPATSVGISMTAGAGGVSKGDPVYISGANTVLKGDPSVDAKSIVIGVASANIGAAASGNIQMQGIIVGANSGAAWTPGIPVFMKSGGGLTQNPVADITTRHRTIMVGTAVNGADLLVGIRDYGKKP